MQASTPDRHAEPARPLRIIAIGKDVDFLRSLLTAGTRRGVTLAYARSLEQIGHIGSLGDFDVVLLDQETDGTVTALEIARYVSALFDKLPVYFLTDEAKPGANSTTISSAVFAKSRGTQAVLDQILADHSPRKPGGPRIMNDPIRHRSRRRFLLLDDDHDYVRTMERAASQLNVTLKGCSVVDEFILESLSDCYAAAIIDYNIDGVRFKGDELARLVEAVPVFIISADDTVGEHIVTRSNVRMAGFISKTMGVRPILKFVRDYAVGREAIGAPTAQRVIVQSGSTKPMQRACPPDVE